MASPLTTRLQRALLKQLAQPLSDGEQQLIKALQIEFGEGLVAQLLDRGGARLVEDVRAKTSSLWACRRPDEAGARLALLLFLLGAEQRLSKADSTLDGRAHVSLGDHQIAQFLGACLVDSGVCLRIDSNLAHVDAQNVITDLPIAEVGVSPLHRIQRECQLRESQARRLPRTPARLLDDEALKARLDAFEEEFGVRFAFGLQRDDALLQSDEVGKFLSALGVGLFSFEVPSRAPVAELRDVASSLLGVLEDIKATIFGRAVMRSSSDYELEDRGLESPPMRAPTKASVATQALPLVFYSYARHRDDKACNDSLLTQLRGLARQGGFELWVDSRIVPGQFWDDEIQCALNRATVGVLMLSKHFLESAYIMDIEVPKLLEKLAPNGRVMPVVLGECTWRSFPQLQRIQAPLEAKPLNRMRRSDRDGATAKIARAIADMCLLKIGSK